ncbi:hypothetical protein BKA70DRAFT_1226219 [Coprinopsis sp. MPI-PUGE-AT-0042]|nr:hypothetical protein BKA70DRAFT_1226219 [Coprinopsis sp. MPI-PUGE-AT-0042]
MRPAIHAREPTIEEATYGGSSGACIAPIDKLPQRPHDSKIGTPEHAVISVPSSVSKAVSYPHLTVVLQTMVPISGQILSGVEGVPPKHNLLGWLWLCPMSRGRYCQLSIWSFRRRLLSTRPAGSWIIAHNGFHQGRPPGHTATLALMSWVVNMADQHPQTLRRGMKERFKTFTERWRKPASRSSSPRPAAGSTSQLVVGQPVNASSGSRSGSLWWDIVYVSQTELTSAQGYQQLHLRH